MNTVRQPAVAGLFYPANPEDLRSDINDYLDQAKPAAVPGQVKAIIVPHAGYVYSGAIAAAAYAALKPQTETIKRVILIGPAHRLSLRGMALISVQYFRTPLGDVAQNHNAMVALQRLPYIHFVNSAHWQEHSLEVQLPFLQTVLKQFDVVPILVGDATSEEVADALKTVWGGQETLIVISSDLSQNQDYETAQYLDNATCHAIEALNIEGIDYQKASGSVPVRGLLRMAAKEQLTVTTMAMANSGDSHGDHNRVVGYGSWVLSTLER